MIVQDAAKAVLEHTLPGERINITYAPPDMWNRQKDTGRTMAEIFMLNGVPIIKSDNNRVQGHMVMKDMLAPIPLKDKYVRSLYPEGQAPAKLPGLMFFDNCKEIMADIRDIQADENNPNDCAKNPHDVTHSVDGCRYFCVNRAMQTEPILPAELLEDEEETGEDYESFMTGGDATGSYMNY